MREYELTVLVDGKLDEKTVSKVVKDLSELLTKVKAKIKSKTDPAKKQMAYEIEGTREAYYLFFDLELDPATVLEVDAKVKLIDNVIRYLLVKKN